MTTDSQHDSSRKEKCIEDITNQFGQHLKELLVFASSCEAYLSFLKNTKACPFELYEKHISYRWEEMIAEWNKLKEDHEVVLSNISDTCFVLSPARASFKGLWKFLQKVKEDYTNASENGFRQLRLLHQWISILVCKIKYFRKVPAYEWSQPFFCSERHTVAHHSRIAVLRNHTNPTIVDIRIGSAGRIKKRRQFHAKYLVLLKQLVDSELMKHKAEEKLPTSLIDRLLKPRIKATSIPSRETIDYTKPYIPFSYGSSTILPERFKQHSEHHHQIVSIVNWEK